MNRKDFINEINTELNMRNRVWKRIPGTTEFVDQEHNRRYRALVELREFLSAMTEKEYSTITQRIERTKSDLAAQTTLFL